GGWVLPCRGQIGGFRVFRAGGCRGRVLRGGGGGGGFRSRAGRRVAGRPSFRGPSANLLPLSLFAVWRRRVRYRNPIGVLSGERPYRGRSCWNRVHSCSYTCPPGTLRSPTSNTAESRS